MNGAASKTFTHYSYLSCPTGVKREPTGLYDLSNDDETVRRAFIHAMVQNGELVAVLPFEDIKNMRQLRGALKWLHENK